METAMALTGGCQCSRARYEVIAEPNAIYVCHCTECRKQSASAFGISVDVPRASLRLTQGRVSSWSRATDGGRRRECFFCPDCGTRLWHAAPDSDADIAVKGGSLDAPPDLTNAVHIWTSRKLAGVVIPDGARQFPGEPDDS
jgi:hypothetical protein